MIFVRTAGRIATAFIGLVAILFAALEHEDLILQPAGSPSVCVDCTPGGFYGSLAATPFTDSTAAQLKPDSGTEGTFRAESHRLRLPPEASGHSWRQEWTVFHRVRCVRLAHQSVWPKFPAIVGITELRL